MIERLFKETRSMATVKLPSIEEAERNPLVKAVYDDIRATRKSDFINNIWRALAFDPPVLQRTWSQIKSVMAVEGALDPLTRELIYIAVSTANSCSYCVHSHTAAARAKGMTDAQHAELMAIIGLAAQTNHLVNAMQLPVDPEFEVK
jgi:AhpD family alkylhydroperoxidase